MEVVDNSATLNKLVKYEMGGAFEEVPLQLKEESGSHSEDEEENKTQRRLERKIIPI